MRNPNCAVAALFLSALASYAQTAHTIAGCRMLPANNVWNTPVDKLPVDPNSATYVNSVGATANLFPDFWNATGGMYLNVVDATQPRVPVVMVDPSESDLGPFPIPANAVVQQDTDEHLMVLSSGNCKLYEMWQAQPAGNGSWSAAASAAFDMSSNVERPATWVSSQAAGMAFMPGMVTYDEVMTGQITHAIGVTVPHTDQRYIWPATAWASYVSGSQYPPMGQRFRLKASFDVSPYPYEVQVILNALKKYGAIVNDNGAPWFLDGLDDPRWNNTNLHTITQVLGSNMEAVDESSLMVDPNSQVAAGSPLALDSIYLSLRQASAGTYVLAKAILTGPAPAGGATIALSVPNAGTLGVPASVTIPPGAASATIPVTVNNIGLTSPATIVGTYQGVTVSSPVLVVNGTTGVLAPRLSSLSVTPASTAGGTSFSATVTLTGAAVAGGTAVSLSSSNPGVLPVPATVTVPSGAVSTTVSLTAGSASSSTSVNLTASLSGESLSFPLTVTAGSAAPPPTAPPPTPPPPTVPPSTTTVAMVNAGGSAYTDPSGNTWSGDYGFSGGGTAQTSANIAGTNSAALYQTCRWGGFTYSFPVSNGNYNVTLKFAEIYFTTPGSRVFNVSINGTPVLTNFDIVAQAGAFTALDKTFPVAVSNGQIAIQFSRGPADQPLVSGISIGGSTSAPPTNNPSPSYTTPYARINAGGWPYTDGSGKTWSGDYDFSGGATAQTSANITSTNAPTLYQSCRWGAFSYHWNVPNGNYTVNLKFAEIYFTTPGSRVFNVAINGASVLTNFDIVAQGGAFTAVDKSFLVTVTNGQISIQFNPGSADLPLVSGIEVLGQ
jgi:hypothetical protein